MRPLILIVIGLVVAAADGEPAKKTDDVQITLTGIVRGPDRAPVADATVWLPTYFGAVKPEFDSRRAGRGTTDAAGRYTFVVEFRHTDLATMFARGVSAQAKGFIRAEVPYKVGPRVKAGDTLKFDIELAKGDVLAGVIDVPLRLADRHDGVKADERQFMTRVQGKSFSQVHFHGKAFELWVPKGVYDIELVYDGHGANLESPSAVLKGIASGSRELRLAKNEPAIEGETLARAFDALWDDMLWHYSYFELKRVDWPALATKYRPRAVAAGTLPTFVDVLGEMLGELNDGHVRFLEPPDAVIAYPIEHIEYNQNFSVSEAAIENATWVGNGFAHVGTTRADGFAVVQITRMSRADDDAVEALVQFVKDHRHAPGFVVDLRGAGGGGEGVAHRIAREFCAKDTIYAKSKYRGGPGPGDFGPTYDRVLEHSDEPYTKPVVCVFGPGCVSSGEAFAKMMKCLPNVTTVGRPTRGSSGNPRPCTLPGVPVTVLYSRWVDMLPNGTPVEGRGVPPEVLVDLPEADYQDADPTWEKALAVLRAKVQAMADPTKRQR